MGGQGQGEVSYSAKKKKRDFFKVGRENERMLLVNPLICLFFLYHRGMPLVGSSSSIIGD
jgi:hypothetical protein